MPEIVLPVFMTKPIFNHFAKLRNKLLFYKDRFPDNSG